MCRRLIPCSPRALSGMAVQEGGGGADHQRRQRHCHAVSCPPRYVGAAAEARVVGAPSVATPFVDGDELRVVSSPTQSRPLNNMEETLWATDAHGLSVGIFHFVSSNLPTHFVSSNLSSWILPFLPSPELILYVMPGMGQKQAEVP